MSLFDPARNYASAEVARLLWGWKAETFRKHLSDLRRKDGFPRPISSVGRARWSGKALNDWRDRQEPEIAVTENANVFVLEGLLNRRAKRVAAGGRR